MTRNLKALGLALVAAFALSAVAASAASAQQAYLTSDGPVTLTGEEVGAASENRMTAFGSFISCPGSTYTGHAVDVTPHEPLARHSTEITITPHYGTCKATALGLHMEVLMNGCDYDFDLGETVEDIENTYDFKTTVRCPEGNHIEMTTNIFGSHCTRTLLENEAGYEGLHFTDNTDGTLTISGTLGGLELHREGPGCPGGTEVVTEGELHQNILVTGHNEEGSPTEIGISEQGESTEEV